jgi:hypothetical protein
MFEFEVKTKETNEGVKKQAYVIEDDEIILSSPAMKTESRAIKIIQSMWRQAVYCSHSYEIGERYTYHDAYGQTREIEELKCKRCELIMRVELETD